MNASDLLRLLTSGKITPLQSRILQLVASYDRGQGLPCPLSNQHMADGLGSDRTTVNKALQKLKKDGFVTREEEILKRGKNDAPSMSKKFTAVQNFKYKVNYTSVHQCALSPTHYAFSLKRLNAVENAERSRPRRKKKRKGALCANNAVSPAHAKRGSASESPVEGATEHKNGEEGRASANTTNPAQAPPARCFEEEAPPPNERVSEGARTAIPGKGAPPKPKKGPDAVGKNNFGLEGHPVQTIVQPCDTEWAGRLYEALKKALLVRSRKISAWGKAFARLRKEVGPDRIETALTWYLAHFRDPFCPTARCGDSFRGKFERIEEAKARHERNNPTPVEVSEEAKGMAAHLGSTLVGQNKVKFPEVIQRSLIATRPIFAKLKVLQARGDPAAHGLVEWWKGPQKMVEDWMRDRISAVFKTPDTFGKITNFVFSLDHKDADQFMSKMVGKYTNPIKWHKLKETLNG